MIKAVVTVVGQDQTGIVAGVANTLADQKVNILDMAQTIMEKTFTMSMLVALPDANDFNKVHDALAACGEKLGVTIHIQREEIFDAMSRV
ncbi:ACT domain-containing protein [Eupransor demetentiae]|uniref:UPF0237 protein R54876_GBNLAHCA_00373 n=1 Tax=Eupransor demetentiae TaxID=3109584 RepID=A0ABP0ENF6_9LACO|nr:ACT domain [Lactobacillaceae bacterium LMG 33000]